MQMLGFSLRNFRKYIVIAVAALCLAQVALAAPTQTITTIHHASKKQVVTKAKVKNKGTVKEAHHTKKKIHLTKAKVVSKKHHRSTHHHAHQVTKKAVHEKENDDDDNTVNTVGENKLKSESTTTATTVTTTTTEHPSLISTIQQRLVNYVYKTVDTLNYNNYKFGGTRFDSRHGVYVLDCSSYVDHLLEQATPNAYFSLVNSTGADKPTTQHYYDFFTDLTSDNNYYWNKVEDVDQLRAGDILVFRYTNHMGNQTGGHVVVVMDKPIRDTNVFFLRVADSAHSRHSQDTRQRHESGIGIGTMLLKVNPKTGQPSAVAWGVGGYWNKNVNFAMARPLNLPNTLS
jgi:cell wall-associated NlpC family hydrolase